MGSNFPNSGTSPPSCPTRNIMIEPDWSKWGSLPRTEARRRQVFGRWMACLVLHHCPSHINLNVSLMLKSENLQSHNGNLDSRQQWPPVTKLRLFSFNQR